MSQYKRYPKYKPSGVDWIGDIPEGWDTCRLRFQLAKIDSGVWGQDCAVDEEGTIVLRSTEQTIDGGWNISDPAVRKLSLSEKTSALLKIGDLVLTKSSGSSIHIGKTSLVSKEIEDMGCCISNFMQRLVPKVGIDSRYIYYVLNSPIGREQLVVGSNTTTGLANLSGTVIGNTLICKMLFNEQKAICNFLDKSTVKIEELIQKKEQVIKLLKEKRAAIINQAVTCGFDEHGNLRQKPKCLPATGWKPSVIDWIGNIPEGWEIRKLKYVAFTKFSSVDKHSKEEEQNVLLCNYVHVYYNNFITKNLNFMEATATLEEIRKFALEKGDVVITKDSESWDDIAIPAYVGDDLNNILCGYHLAIIKAMDQMYGKYIFWSFLSKIINCQFQIAANGVTRYGLGKVSLDKAVFFVPSFKEQQKIADYLGKKTSEIDDLIGRIQSAIEKLREYRSSLITAAVTGKIDVRENAQQEKKNIF